MGNNEDEPANESGVLYILGLVDFLHHGRVAASDVRRRGRLASGRNLRTAPRTNGARTELS